MRRLESCKKNAACLKDQDTLIEPTGPLTQRLRVLEAQLQHRTREFRLLAAREEQAVTRQCMLEQHLNASRLDLEAFKWQIHAAEKAVKENEDFASRLFAQGRESDKIRH